MGEYEAVYPRNACRLLCNERDLKKNMPKTPHNARYSFPNNTGESALKCPDMLLRQKTSSKSLKIFLVLKGLLMMFRVRTETVTTLPSWLLKANCAKRSKEAAKVSAFHLSSGH